MTRNRSSLTAGLVFLLASAAARGDEKPPFRPDFYGAPLPPGAVARLGTARLRQFNVDSLTFSKDGKHLLTSSKWDGSIRIWDAASGKLVARKRFPLEPGKKERFWSVD